ncbi:hypothetical protein B0A50_00322 [Salinomyces thailandicus]|uniref:serine--tRNA ligase n=1 Tax=Salinomyces thailandicus TaxID=706561 RepID=A0A4U0UFL1_9PEZI|nr:hypothetical protein B0A50_00322 [Salinomyces thailandica]
MKLSLPFTALSRLRPSQHRCLRVPPPAKPRRQSYTRPSFAPKPTPNLKHIRHNPGLYEQNCVDRNYAPYARNGWRVLELHEQLVQKRREAVELRQRNNVIGRRLKGGGAEAGAEKEDVGREGLLEEARSLKRQLAGFEAEEKGLEGEMERLGLELPNLSSSLTPTGRDAEVIGHINGDTPPLHSKNVSGKGHVDIGRELDLLDFEASATTSGWGWYFLRNEGAWLEQALIQYALSVAHRRGWTVTTPPSLVYAHIAHACGFAPRDQGGEQQIYHIAPPPAPNTDVNNKTRDDQDQNNPSSLVLAGTAEIPFAGSLANKTLPASILPRKLIGPSRCYRAEAGARGVDTKGLYRVHEFTKVEMFAWTAPATSSNDNNDHNGNFETEDLASSPANPQADQVFNEMLAIQTEILTNLGLHARILEMPTTDLGASAARKIDIEAFFPSRATDSSDPSSGYGEVTSVSLCTDYQARRLNTRVKFEDGGGTAFAETVNGTALAIPRVLAAVLEAGWDDKVGGVRVPEVLRRWMPGGNEVIGGKEGDE